MVTLHQVRTRCLVLPAPTPAEVLVPGSRAAAVLIAVFEEFGDARVILTKRPDTMPSHRGEIAFPGGKLHPGVDALPVDAALREAEEEIGLQPAVVEVIAELDGIATVGSRFTITPFVGLLPDRPELVPNEGEVERVFDVAIADLLADGAYREERWELRGREQTVSFFELPGETVWGATARILTSLLTHLVADR
jgi:8-oxo-dGTP pyrophosphatase MutT (NUDIX family)